LAHGVGNVEGKDEDQENEDQDIFNRDYDTESEEFDENGWKSDDLMPFGFDSQVTIQVSEAVRYEHCPY
jgi:hypothetical protein